MGAPPPHHSTNGTAPPGTTKLTDSTPKVGRGTRTPTPVAPATGNPQFTPPAREHSPEGRPVGTGPTGAGQTTPRDCYGGDTPPLHAGAEGAPPHTPRRPPDEPAHRVPGLHPRGGGPPEPGASETEPPPRGSPPHGKCPPVGRERIAPPPPQAGTRNPGRTDGSRPGADPALPWPPGRNGNTTSPPGASRREDGPPHGTRAAWDEAPNPAPADRTGARQSGQGETPLNRNGHTWAKSGPAAG